MDLQRLVEMMNMTLTDPKSAEEQLNQVKHTTVHIVQQMKVVKKKKL